MKDHWSLISVTENGVVSVIRNVTEEECKFYYQVLLPRYGVTEIWYETTRPPEHHHRTFRRFWQGGQEVSFPVDNVRFAAVEVFGPPGWDNSVVLKWKAEWPKRDTITPEDPRNHFEDWYQKFGKDLPDKMETYDPRRGKP